MKITKTNNTRNNTQTNDLNVYATYAAFLVQCRKVMGPFDVEKLAHDEAYKTEFFNRVSLSADDKLFDLANLVSRQLDEELLTTH